eukprot:TRINITY_DN20788_c0_g1_i1.p1 TRINITY_DN20788_c0_g1~~TRINITY_DN20788_c0_g1_i1.p1  ORF type:complete len:425 (+),score=187.95 TRINITY_DN20788_c0_g1_i1:54-1328(+)
MDRSDTNLEGEMLRGESFLGEYNGRWLPQRNLMKRVATFAKGDDEDMLPEPAEEDKYLVVFDLDETLVYARDGPLSLRPHAKELLHRCGEISEVALWTAGVQSYAKAVLIELEKKVWGKSPSGVIQHCISRHKRWYDEADYTKDLTLLGRDLDKVLIIENTPDCVRLNPKNAIIVEDFEGEKDQGHTLTLLKIVIEELVASGKPVQQFIPKCKHLKKQDIEGVGPVYYLSATGKDAMKVVKLNRDKKQPAKVEGIDAHSAQSEGSESPEVPAPGQLGSLARQQTLDLGSMPPPAPPSPTKAGGPTFSEAEQAVQRLWGDLRAAQLVMSKTKNGLPLAIGMGVDHLIATLDAHRPHLPSGLLPEKARAKRARAALDNESGSEEEEEEEDAPAAKKAKADTETPKKGTKKGAKPTPKKTPAKKRSK